MPDQYWLSKGSHESPEDGRCAMEWISHLSGEGHTDHPKCVDPLLTQFIVLVNDAMTDEDRQRLRPYLARCIGTAGDGRMHERAVLLANRPRLEILRTDRLRPCEAAVQEILVFLDRLLPTEHIDLPDTAPDREDVVAC